MITTHSFTIDLFEQASSRHGAEVAREQILLRTIFEIANECNKLGLSGERVVNIWLIREPEQINLLAIGYTVKIQTESAKDSPTITVNRALPG